MQKQSGRNHSRFRKLIHTSCVLSFIIVACTGSKGPVSAEWQSYQTTNGMVEQVDSYPLYMFTYSGDYKFDEYLKTGDMPFFSSVNQKSKNFACTCFSVFGDDYRFLARNYDWSDRSSYYVVFTNPPDGYSSVSTVDMYFFNYDHSQPPDYEGNQNTLRTIPYYPFDGMNEKGVAVGMNALSHARGPYDQGNVTIGELQVIRLVLDYAASTSEAISLIKEYNVRFEDPPIHYLIADSSGHSVILEFLDGKMNIMENSEPWQVTTNFIISDFSDPNDAGCWRYQTADQTLSTRKGVLSGDNALDLLQQVSVPATRWSLLYNLKTGQAQMAMGRKWDDMLTFELH